MSVNSVGFYYGEERKFPSNENFGRQVRDAAQEPLKNLQTNARKWNLCGRITVCVLRPSMAVSQLLMGTARKGWEKLGVDSAIHAAIATVCNVSLVMTSCCRKRRRNRVTMQDVREWQVTPKLSPEQLVKCREIGAAFDRRVPVITTLAKGIGATASGVNCIYRKCYGEDLLPPLPMLPPQVRDLLFGAQSLSERVDNFLVASLVAQPILMSDNAQQQLLHLGLLGFPGIVLQDLNRVKYNLGQAAIQACRDTLANTRNERIALIKSLEGLALSYLYTSIVSKLPSKEKVIREATLFVLQQYFNTIAGFGLNAARYFFPAHLQSAINCLPSALIEWGPTVARLDFIGSAANKLGAAATATVGSPVGVALSVAGGTALGSLAGMPMAGALTATALSASSGALTKQLFLHGTTKGIEHGVPAAMFIYQFLYQELDQLASAGNQRINQFSSIGGLYDLFQGNVHQVDRSAPVDPNQSYLVPIASEFVLGTISRLCEQRGMMAVLQNAMAAMTKKREADPAAPVMPATPAMPGVQETKAAFITLLSAVQASLTENLPNRTKAVIAEEIEFQKQNAREVEEAIQANQKAIQASCAATVESYTGIPAGLVEGALNLPNLPGQVVGNILADPQAQIENAVEVEAAIQQNEAAIQASLAATVQSYTGVSAELIEGALNLPNLPGQAVGQAASWAYGLFFGSENKQGENKQ